LSTHTTPELIEKARTDQFASAALFLTESAAVVTPLQKQIQHTLNAEHVSSELYARELEDDIAFLLGHGFDFNVLWTVQQTAKHHAVEAHLELIANGHIAEDTYYHLLAHHVGLPFLHKIEPKLIEIDLSDRGIISRLRDNPRLLLRTPTGLTKMVLAPQQRETRDLLMRLANTPELRNRFTIASPSTIKNALLDHLKNPLEQHASSSMWKFMPQFSAFKINKSAALWVCTIGFIGLLTLIFFGHHIIVVT